jgi:hypothetical protein
VRTFSIIEEFFDAHIYRANGQRISNGAYTTSDWFEVSDCPASSVFALNDYRCPPEAQ